MGKGYEDAVAAFDPLNRSLDYPMLIVTTASHGEPAGCLIGFWSQCSIDPVRCMLFLSKANRTLRIARHADTLVAHILRADDFELARHFGEHTGDEISKFKGIDWVPGPGGAPTLEGLDWFAGSVRDTLDAGDHIGFLIDVLESIGSAARADEPQLGYGVARSIDAGHDA